MVWCGGGGKSAHVQKHSNAHPLIISWIFEMRMNANLYHPVPSGVGTVQYSTNVPI